MFANALSYVAGNSWIAVVAAFIFFTLKGLAWLLVPYLFLRFRKRSLLDYPKSQESVR